MENKSCLTNFLSRHLVQFYAFLSCIFCGRDGVWEGKIAEEEVSDVIQYRRMRIISHKDIPTILNSFSSKQGSMPNGFSHFL